MKVSSSQEAAPQIMADALVIGIHSDASLSGNAAAVDEATGGAVARLIEGKEITGKANEVTPLLAPSGVQAGQVVVVGLGGAEKFDVGAAHRAAGSAAKHLAGKQRDKVAFCFDGWTAEQTEAGISGAMVGCQGQDLYRAKKDRHPIGEVIWVGDDAAVSSGQVLGNAMNLTRRLVNEPPQEIYPETFAEEANKVAAATGLDIEIWDERKLADERCGSLLAVARGSVRPPRLVILRYNGGPADQKPLSLVGKGVTFDSGGLSLKPSEGMSTMKLDMAGAASVLGAMQAIAELKLPINAIGLVGLVENLVSGDCYKLGDVLTARTGKTIEVLNTDAEGRLVLADVLAVAVDEGAAKIIDLATLTGACVVALGMDVVGLMTNDQDWCDTIAEAAETCGERAWQLPMFPEFAGQIKSDVADIKNIGAGRWGGAITAAKFLEEFVGDVPWTHIDIAGPAFAEKPKPWVDGGGSGAMVRTLVEVARGWK